MNGTVFYLKKIVNILKEYLQYDDKQIYIFQQRHIIPNDDKTYIALSLVNEKIIGNIKKYNYVDEKEEHDATICASISLDAFSRKIDLLDEKNKILFALNSDISFKMQDKYNFLILHIPNSLTIVNENTENFFLYRINFLFKIFYSYKEAKNVFMYDNFNNLIFHN